MLHLRVTSNVLRSNNLIFIFKWHSFEKRKEITYNANERMLCPKWLHKCAVDDVNNQLPQSYRQEFVLLTRRKTVADFKDWYDEVILTV